ncbi:protein ELYS-like [Sinocyclocheilus rhinocerous]|uniref:protein ELYS-like n=1 Tax=Sinocyclocheilus rhinocerous TaxID=307959 RepID=UPI0007B9FF29|nr:PREDICTED: protein ELYS-like [Sinocyclocheilus rhinocerous]
MKGALSGSLWNIWMMLNTEVSWNKALTDNNIKGLIGCIRGLYNEGEGDASERAASFNCWLQRSAELAKKELLMFCFGRYKGLWMCLDENTVALVHKLLLKLKNLLSLVHRNTVTVCILNMIMYFVLDVSNFLHCKDDLLQSFCHVFSIPSAFSQQICGFWLLDHGLVTDSMNVLLSPRACPPTLSWHHCAVLKTLLKTGENRAALKYLYSITLAMENVHDINLRVDVLIHNKCISEAWALIRGLQTEDVHLFKHFIHVYENRGI